MLFLLLAAAAPQTATAAARPQTAVEAERAFAADAQRIGQWAAFRKWATIDATLFVPQPVQALDWLRNRPEPARAVAWWPTASWQACNGGIAVNTGGWRRPDGSVGYFTTVWQRQGDGSWQWLVDHGDALGVARARTPRPVIRRAACTGRPPAPAYSPPPPTGEEKRSWSGDLTLSWRWQVEPDGARRLTVDMWDGRRYATVIDDRVAGTPQ